MSQDERVEAIRARVKVCIKESSVGTHHEECWKYHNLCLAHILLTAYDALRERTCGCIVCICANPIKCQGCGAKSCEQHATLRDERDRLAERLERDTCNTGHKTLPLKLWDCPECTRIKVEALQAKLQQAERERDALQIYAWHLRTCPAVNGSKQDEPKCDCGYNSWKG